MGKTVGWKPPEIWRVFSLISLYQKRCFFSENQTKTVVYVNLGKAVRPEENIWLSITGKKENVRRAREMLQEKLDQFY